MRAETWRAGKLDKLIDKAGGAIIECKAPDERTATAWCIKRCEKRHAARLEPDAAQLLVARIGPELQHLDTELGKLAVMAGTAGAITRELVAQAVGPSREEKAWEIQSAIVTGNAAVMLRKLRELLDISRQDVVPISWAICDLLRKIHAASQLLRRNVPRPGVMGQLKLWGNTVDPILNIAGRTPPQSLAQLLQIAIQTDANTKSGVGDPQRSLEALMVRIADTFSGSLRNA
jgi:DNA polymerase III delta subunit